MEAIQAASRSFKAQDRESPGATLSMLLTADLKRKVLQDLLSHAANEGSPGELFDATEILRLVCKDWAAEVLPMKKAQADRLLRELSQLEGLEGISEHKLRTDRNLDLRAAFKNAPCSSGRVNMLLAVLHSNRALETINLSGFDLPVKKLKGEDGTTALEFSSKGLTNLDAIVIASLIKDNVSAQIL